MNASSARFVGAAPRPQREVLRALLFLAVRPRGRSLLGLLPLALQAADSVVAMARYDDERVAEALGWDAEAVTARGRALRRAEGRP